MANRPNQQTDRQKQPRIEQMTQPELPLEPMENEIMTDTTLTHDPVSSPSHEFDSHKQCVDENNQNFSDENVCSETLTNQTRNFETEKIDPDLKEVTEINSERLELLKKKQEIESDLAKIKNETDPLVKELMAEELQKKHPKIYPTIDSIFKVCDNSDLDENDDISNYVACGKEYFEGLDQEEELILPYLGCPGVGIMYGDSGTQKSSFLYYISKSLTIRDYSDWCNEYYPVLIFQLEENRRITDKRFADVLEHEDFKNICIVRKEHKNKKKAISWTVDNKNLLIKMLERYKPKLVIIDSLSKATSGKISPKDSEYANFIFDYQDIAEFYNVTIIFNHHELKNTNQFAGTQKLKDNVDFMFHWTTVDETVRYLEVIKNRLADDSLGKKYKYKIDMPNSKWSYLGESDGSVENPPKKPQLDKVTQAVMDLLLSVETPLTLDEITARLQDDGVPNSSRTTVERKLKKLEENNQIAIDNTVKPYLFNASEPIDEVEDDSSCVFIGGYGDDDDAE